MSSSPAGIRSSCGWASSSRAPGSRFRFRVLGFRVWGLSLGFGVQGLGSKFRVWGSGFGV